MLRKNKLSYWRKVRGLSQGDLAGLIGVTNVTISNWERDVTHPTRAQVYALSNVLLVSARDLFPFEPY